MFVIKEDKSIYLTRGDVAFFSVTANTDTGEAFKFHPGDIVRFKVFEKKACENVVLSKDFGIEVETEEIEILLEEKDTKIGEVISKPTDYWYEVELNPYTDPQTIIGYDEDGAKIFKLFPEGNEAVDESITPEDIPIVDAELDLSSSRPIQNQAVARAFITLKENLNDEMTAYKNEVNSELIKFDDSIEEKFTAFDEAVDEKLTNFDTEAEQKLTMLDEKATELTELCDKAEDEISKFVVDITDTFLVSDELDDSRVTFKRVYKQGKTICGDFTVETILTEEQTGLLRINSDYIPTNPSAGYAALMSSAGFSVESVVPIAIFSVVGIGGCSALPCSHTGAATLNFNFTYTLE